ncbi:Hypothetical protein CINCED_3A004743, partial [Cinara cedri]
MISGIIIKAAVVGIININPTFRALFCILAIFAASPTCLEIKGRSTVPIAVPITPCGSC